MCCVFLDIYSPMQRNNNEKKGNWMHPGLVEKPMFASGIECAIDSWVFFVGAQLHNYYLTITTPMLASHCVVAVALRHSSTP